MLNNRAVLFIMTLHLTDLINEIDPLVTFHHISQSWFDTTVCYYIILYCYYIVNDPPPKPLTLASAN